MLQKYSLKNTLNFGTSYVHFDGSFLDKEFPVYFLHTASGVIKGEKSGREHIIVINIYIYIYQPHNYAFGILNFDLTINNGSGMTCYIVGSAIISFFLN